ncbi:hypothetical protein F5H01DRAFT_57777 [Linnemannia elongata]|nr:hypothetical protein F5H01DRAFT_57777 [Linnemannia elongata]
MKENRLLRGTIRVPRPPPLKSIHSIAIIHLSLINLLAIAISTNRAPSPSSPIHDCADTILGEGVVSSAFAFGLSVLIADVCGPAEDVDKSVVC